MKTLPGSLIVLLTLLAGQLCGTAQGTAFTYQGQLNDGGSPANGLYDLQFSLYNAPDEVFQIGNTVTNLAVGVTNGLFTTTIDFGSVFDGTALWLDIGVETNGAGGDFTDLSALQPLTPEPYSIYATSAGTASYASYSSGASTANGVANGAVTSAGIAPGQVVKSLNGLMDYVYLLAGANVTITPSGNTLTINSVGTAGPPGPAGSATNAWNLTGNAGTSPGNGNFLGTLDNQPLELHVDGVRAFRLEPDASGYGAPNVVGGSPVNFVASGIDGATIGGGGVVNYAGLGAFSNSVTGSFGTVGGGFQNTVNASDGTVGGGAYNQSGNYGTVAGGLRNYSNGGEATVGGGEANVAGGQYSTVGGGIFNSASGTGAFVGGGGADGTNTEGNAASGPGSMVGGGLANIANNSYAVVSGGHGNNASGPGSFVGGGGWDGYVYNGNTASGGAATVTGGGENTASGLAAAVGGGYDNAASGEEATVGGGLENVASGTGAVVAGGDGYNVASATAATVGGGYGNDATNEYAFAGGGEFNVAGGEYSTVGGGYQNSATGYLATATGGSVNHAKGTYATVGGGYSNTSSGTSATVPGGYENTAAGEYSFAAGNQANAANQGAFVWADSQNAAFSSTASDQFCVRAQGGVQLDPATSLFFGSTTRQMLNLYGTAYGIGVQSGTMFFRSDAGFSNSGDFSWFRGGSFNSGQDQPGTGGQEMMRLDHTGNLNVLHSITANSLILTSDRSVKTNFTSVDAQSVLAKVSALPITAWNYKSESGVKHVGPMAQDFYAAFGTGADDKHIAVVDEGGVALAAIQGLNQQVQAKEARIEQQAGEIADLQARLENLEKIVNDKLGSAK